MLGSDEFRSKAERRARIDVRQTPRARRTRAAVPLARDVALWRGQIEGQLTSGALADAFGLGNKVAA